MKLKDTILAVGSRSLDILIHLQIRNDIKYREETLS